MSGRAGGFPLSSASALRELSRTCRSYGVLQEELRYSAIFACAKEVAEGIDEQRAQESGDCHELSRGVSDRVGGWHLPRVTAHTVKG